MHAAKVAKPLVLGHFSVEDVASSNEDSDHPFSYSKALVSKPIPASLGKTPVYFVRPATEPYYGLLYGAHSYWHWLVVNGREIFAASSDGFELLDSATNGMRDIEERICMTGQCAHTHMQFDGHTYRPVSCRLREVESGKDVGACEPEQLLN